MALCAACKSRVEDGAVRCLGCGAALGTAASFAQVVGWVLVAVSTIPLGLGIVAEGSRDHVPLAVGVAVFILGVVLIAGGRARQRRLPPAVVPDEEV